MAMTFEAAFQADDAVRLKVQLLSTQVNGRKVTLCLTAGCDVLTLSYDDIEHYSLGLRELATAWLEAIGLGPAGGVAALPFHHEELLDDAAPEPISLHSRMYLDGDPSLPCDVVGLKMNFDDASRSSADIVLVENELDARVRPPRLVTVRRSRLTHTPGPPVEATQPHWYVASRGRNVTCRICRAAFQDGPHHAEN
jgi:hypothetical protein